MLDRTQFADPEPTLASPPASQLFLRSHLSALGSQATSRRTLALTADFLPRVHAAVEYLRLASRRTSTSMLSKSSLISSRHTSGTVRAASTASKIAMI